MNISVLGCGRWGSFHAWYADKIGHDVVLWGRPGSKNLAELRDRHANEYLQMPESVELSDDLSYAVERADIIIISIGAQQLRSFAGQLAELPIKNKTFVLCMKGLEIGTGKRLSVVMREEVGPEPDIAVWVGPGHV